MTFLYKLILGVCSFLFILFFGFKDKAVFSFFVVLILFFFFGDIVFVLVYSFFCFYYFFFLGLAGILTLGIVRFKIPEVVFIIILAFCLCSILVWWRVSFSGFGG